MATSSNFFTASGDWSSAQHEAAAAAIGFQARIFAQAVMETRPTHLDDGILWAVDRLVRQAAHHAHQAEQEDERMGRVLAAQVSYGHGPALTDEEIERANVAHCRACSSIPCRCCGERREA